MDGPSNKRKECQETIKEGMLNIESIKSEWKLYNEKLPNNPEISYKHASNILKWCPHSVQAKVAQGKILEGKFYKLFYYFLKFFDSFF